MYKIFVNKTFIYSNVIIEKFITINSPWIPRIGETISTISIQGKIKELTNGYGDKPSLSITLEEYKTISHCSGLDVSVDINYCDSIRACKYLTDPDDAIIVHQKGRRYIDAEDGKSVEIQDIKFDGKAFDKEFGD